jgi:hypothetical protein
VVCNFRVGRFATLLIAKNSLLPIVQTFFGTTLKKESEYEVLHKIYEERMAGPVISDAKEMRLAEKRNTHASCQKRVEERDGCKVLHIDGKIIFKWIVRKQNWMVWSRFICLRTWTTGECPCEHSHEFSGYMKHSKTINISSVPIICRRDQL